MTDPRAIAPSEASIRASSGAYERLRILMDNPVIAMVGLSADPMRPSHFAAIYMQSEGFRVIPVNPRYAGGEILGRPFTPPSPTSPNPSASSMSSASPRRPPNSPAKRSPSAPRRSGSNSAFATMRRWTLPVQPASMSSKTAA